MCLNFCLPKVVFTSFSSFERNGNSGHAVPSSSLKSSCYSLNTIHLLWIFFHKYYVLIYIMIVNNYTWDNLFIHLFTYYNIWIISDMFAPKKILNSTSCKSSKVFSELVTWIVACITPFHPPYHLFPMKHRKYFLVGKSLFSWSQEMWFFCLSFVSQSSNYKQVHRDSVSTI